MIVTLKIMPVSPDVNLEELLKNIKNKIEPLGAGIGKHEFEDVAFGLKAIKIIFIYNEEKSVEEIEDKIKEIDEVSTVDVTDMRRTIG